MAYTINLTNGNSLIPGGLSDGTYDNSHSSLVLIGKNYAGYGEFLNENFVRLLENFANSSGPPNPLKGQLWWDTINNILKVYSGTSWKISTGATSAPANSPPGDLSALGGDLWFDTTNNQLKVYSGTSWVTVGPAASAATGDTGAFPVIMADSSGGGHIVIQLRFSGVVYAIFSKDTFTSAMPGFVTIKAGLNFSTTASPSWVLSTQDVAATAGTLVQRDAGGGITVNGISSTSISTASLTATAIAGNITIPTGSTFTSTGFSSYNGLELATVGGTGQFSAINNTPIGNATPSTGQFTSLSITGTQGVTLGVGGIKPVGNANIDVGTTSYYFNNVYTKNLTAIANIAPTGNLGATLGSSTNWFSDGYIGSVNILTGITPAANVAADLGSSGNYFNNGYLNAMSIVRSITPLANLNATLGSSTRYFAQTYSNVVTAASAVVDTITLSGNIVPTSNLASNLGSSTNWFNNIYGTAIHAQYADLAERFEADAEYDAGTVVEMGGEKEITAVGQDLSDSVFGVISTKAAYLMNSGAGTDKTHPPIAVQGRVPVKVVGAVRKGDRLVSAGNGMARAGKKEEITTWNVIGRALEHKTTNGPGVIEAVVKLNS